MPGEQIRTQHRGWLATVTQHGDLVTISEGAAVVGDHHDIGVFPGPSITVNADDLRTLLERLDAPAPVDQGDREALAVEIREGLDAADGDDVVLDEYALADAALAWFAAQPKTVTAEEVDRAVDAMGKDAPPRFIAVATARALGFAVTP